MARLQEIQGKLLKLGAQMAARVGMPYDCQDDWQFPKSVSMKQRARIIEQVDRANEQCRLWAIALRGIVDELKHAPELVEEKFTPTSNRYMIALGVFEEFLMNSEGEVRGPFQAYCRERLDVKQGENAAASSSTRPQERK